MARLLWKQIRLMTLQLALSGVTGHTRDSVRIRRCSSETRERRPNFAARLLRTSTRRPNHPLQPRLMRRCLRRKGDERLRAARTTLFSPALCGDACVERGTANPLNRLGADAKAGGD